MTHRHPGLLRKLAQKLSAALRGKAASRQAGLSDKGLLVFSHTGEVIRAEALLRKAGFPVEVKGPPPWLRTGCDMVVLFPLISRAAVANILMRSDITPLQTASVQDALLEPVSLFQTQRLGHWLMVRAANMKITIDLTDDRIVNISGGGCPDVPWLAQNLCGLPLSQAPEPLSLGQTLCCYSLQKAFEEIRRQRQCG
ncbi:DUF3343 domain-containing protein [Desulfovibrio sp. ZJ200]|uniref:DUF3343 domain-containing protein n=1 Tax=Desulfovibrio sp. ZJ200 TaxID=2709792 RepID=UPI0013EC8E1B|nr:DUF3343 domain-containing protein [Desulfovibrio sp. ZJ200]